MRRSLQLLLVLSLIGFTSEAQQINRAEYSIDFDNGVGTGTPIDIGTAGNLVNQSFFVPMNTLSLGFHRLDVRVRNTNGIWSHQLTSMFYVLPNIALGGNSNINRAEYFIDNDPGTGSGISINIATAGSTIIQNTAISIGSLSQGFHRLVIRVCNLNGTWSEQLSSLFYVLPPAPALANAIITKAEYFVDTDPGVGNGISIPSFTSGASVSSAFNIPLNTLSQGFHRLCVRVRDANGVWSEHLSSLFYILPQAPILVNSNITKAEYFIDTDPGISNGTVIPPFTSGNSVSSAFLIPVSTLTQGFHRLNVRLRNGDGLWSHQLSSLFYVLPNLPTTQQQQIVAAEWFVNTDPGVGFGTPITSITAGNNVTILADISVASLNLTNPNNILGIRVKDQSGKWSLHLAAPFQICQPLSTANFTNSNACPGAAITFTSTSTNVPSGATFQWDFNNDGVVDATGIGPHQYTYGTSGNYNAVLRVIEPACVSQIIRPISVPVVNPPIISVSGGNTTICDGTTVQLSTNLGSAYSWSNGAGTTQQVNVGPGTYTVNVTNTNGCSAISAPITINSAPASPVSISASGATSFCPGGSVDLTANPAGASYAWNTGQASRMITASGNGTFTATITPTGSCPGVASVTVSLLPLPNVSAGLDVFIPLGSSTTLIATGAESYVWSPPDGLSSTTGASVEASPSETKTYNVSGIGLNGCTGIDQVIVNVVQPNVSFSGLLATYCSNAQSSTLLGSPTGGTFSGPGITGNIFNPANAGIEGLKTITYMVVNGLGETVSTSQTTTVLAIPQANIVSVGEVTVCSPNTISLTASGGIAYQWSGGPATAQFIASSTGNYLVTVTAANTCQDTASLNVIINPQPTANIIANGSTTFCTGGSVELVASQGTRFNWLPGGQTSQSLTVNASGSYAVQVFNVYGCSNTSSPMEVNVTSSPTAPQIQATNSTTICNGGTVNLVSNINNVEWLRQGNSSVIGTGASIQVDQAGIYYARYTESCGSVNSNTVQVFIGNLQTPTFVNIEPFCEGSIAPILPLISTNGFSGIWNPATISNTTSNQYTFTPNANQCANSKTISVTVNSLPTVNAGDDVSIVAGLSTPLTATGATSYEWSPSTGLNVTNAASVVASPLLTTTYTVTGASASNCFAQDQVVVTVNQPTIASFSGLAQNYCLFSTSSNLIGIPVGGVFSGPGISGNSFNPSQAGTGIKTITYTVIGSNGTLQTSQNTLVTLSGNSAVTVSICPGETYTLPNGQVVGIGTYNTQIDNGNGCFSNLTTTVNPLNLFIWYADSDGDTFGDVHSSLTACVQPAGYVSNSNDCDDSNPNINPNSQTLSYTGLGNFSNAIIFPQTGSPSTIFTFSVVYTDANGGLPPFGFPRAILDYEGNGVFSNSNDRTILLTAVDASDINTVDGKVYIGSISALTSGVNYTTRIQVQNNGCTTQIGPFNYPDILTEPDLEIFADDISFSNPTPPVSSPLLISAVIRNISDFPAVNFSVSLTNQYNPSIVYPSIVVPYLAPNTNTHVEWNIITPSEPAWCPMEVFVDNENVIIESNELDNRAIRPFVNGNFILPGGIAVTANASPAVQFVAPIATITVSGYAEYFDTAVPLNDPSVAGASVSLTSAEGSQYYGTTNSAGFFSITFPISASTPGIFTITGEITDYTLTGPFQVTYEIVPNPTPVCLPDLVANVTVSDNQIFPGESVNGTVSVRNVGCSATNTTTLLDISQTGGLPSINDVAVPPLAVGATFTTSFNTITFNQLGTFYICGTADANFQVEESSEGNNTGCAAVTVVPPLPDITPVLGPYNSVYLCTNPANPSFTIANVGYVETGSFDYTVNVYYEGNPDGTFTFTQSNLGPQSSFGFSIPYQLTHVGLYTFLVTCDIPMPVGIVNEISELNNTGTYGIQVLACKPDLVVLGCGQLEVDPVDIDFPSIASYTARVRNQGNAIAVGPVGFDFIVSGGGTYSLTYAGTIAPGETIEFTTNAPSVVSGTALLTGFVDPSNNIEELYDGNNQYSDSLCWDFEMLNPCGNYWPSNFAPNQTFVPYIGFLSNHLYKASEVKVRFEVSGPGIIGNALLGDVLLNDVVTTCNCPLVISTPNSFLFTEIGTYTFTFTVDPDNVYSECNELNNVFSHSVNVTNFADYRIVSEFINPTLLNPDVGESVFFDITYENIGVSNAAGQPDMSILIDELPLDVLSNVPGLINGQNITVAVPSSYSSDLPGVHVVRAIIDSQDEIIENNEMNNEATRAFVVGSAANLYFVSFVPSDASPTIGQLIDIDAIIQNNGDIAVNADVRFSFVDDFSNVIQIGTIPISLGPGESTSISLPWNVLDNNTTLQGVIVNVSEIEFNPDDNYAFATLGAFDVLVTSIPFCQGGNQGSLTANGFNGIAPYTYIWNTGYIGPILQAAPGNYSVTVTDNQGFSVVSSGSIGIDSTCIAQTCDINPVSFSVSPICNPTTGLYDATVTLSYSNAPNEGFIEVNGTSFSITGSPQTFNLTVGEGAVIFNAFFTFIPTCSLTLVTGITRGPCRPVCPDNSTVSIIICEGDQYQLPDGNMVSNEGEYVVQMTENGCTYSITTILKVISTAPSTISVGICQGGTYMLPDGQNVTSGEYVTQVNNGFGCFATITTMVNEIVSEDVYTEASSCSGVPYTLPNGTIVSPNQTTTYTVPSNNPLSGCSYNTFVTLNILPKPDNSTLNATICQGDVYYLPNGEGVREMGNYPVNVETEAGCSYTITVNLTVNPSLTSTVDTSIQQGENYTLPDGIVVNETGQYTSILQTSDGCPNTIITHLTVVNLPGGCFATSVIAAKSLQGFRKSGQPVLIIRSNPAEALGAPDPVIVNVANFYSLGFAGYLTVKFNEPIANGDGPDVRVHEATWNYTCNNYPEMAEIFGSQDGCNFVYMGNVCHTGDVSIPAEMTWIQYVQVRDISNTASFTSNDDGYDVAAVECLHGLASSISPADLTAGTLQDILSYNPGPLKNGGLVPTARRDASKAIGLPGGSGVNFVSLGFGGSLVGKFDFVVFNLDGLDLQVVETSYGNPSCNNYPERARIFGSKTGIDYSYIGSFCQDGSVNLGNMVWLQYIMITDTSQVESSKFNGASDGFDVDGAVDLHACTTGFLSRINNSDNITEPDVEWISTLYPNPSFGLTNLELIDLSADGKVALEIFDATGRLLYRNTYTASDGKINIPIDISHLALGIYQLHILTDSGARVLKLMKN